MELDVKDDRYGDFLQYARHARRMRIDNAAEHFWREIGERGATILDRFYECSPEDVKTVEALLEQERKGVKEKTRLEELQENLAFMKDCVEYVFDADEIVLKTINELETYSLEEIDAFYKTHLTKEKAKGLIAFYGDDPAHPKRKTSELVLMDFFLTAKLLGEVNKACGHNHLNDFNLIKACLWEEDEIEVFLNGTPGSEAFVAWAKENQQRLEGVGKVTKGQGGITGLLFNELKGFGELFGWEVKKVKKATGEKERREKLVSNRKRQGDRLPKAVAEQKARLKDELTTEKKVRGQLTGLEAQYYETIGDRAVLTRRPILSKELYEEIRDFVNGTGPYELEIGIG